MVDAAGRKRPAQGCFISRQIKIKSGVQLKAVLDSREYVPFSPRGKLRKFNSKGAIVVGMRATGGGGVKADNTGSMEQLADAVASLVTQMREEQKMTI